jgi:hypothetical protein
MSLVRAPARNEQESVAELSLIARGSREHTGHVAFACVAAVVAIDGVRFATAARTRAELFHELATYVRGRAHEQLWPGEALIVEGLLGSGDECSAVERYFACVGERWDEEWLVMTDVTSAASRDPSAPA